MLLVCENRLGDASARSALYISIYYGLIRKIILKHRAMMALAMTEEINSRIT